MTDLKTLIGGGIMGKSPQPQQAATPTTVVDRDLKKLLLPDSVYNDALQSLVGPEGFKNKRVFVVPGLIGSPLHWLSTHIGDKGSVTVLESDPALCPLVLQKTDNLGVKFSLLEKTLSDFCGDAKLQKRCDILYCEFKWPGRADGRTLMYCEDQKTLLGEGLKGCTVDTIVVCGNKHCDFSKTLKPIMGPNIGSYSYGTLPGSFNPVQLKGQPRMIESGGAKFCLLTRNEKQRKQN